MSNSYTLHVHDQERENELEDIDDYETIVYKFPYSLKWEVILETLGTDFNVAVSSFKYIDEDNDKVTIGSQEEYDIALQFCKKSKDCLHIYNENVSFQAKKEMEENRQQENFEILGGSNSLQREENDRLLRPPDYEEEEREAVEGNLSDAGETNDDEEDDSSKQDSMVSSTMEEETAAGSREEETRPMPIRIPYLDTIKKEVHQMVRQELEKYLGQFQQLKEEIKERRQAVGEHSVLQEQTETVQSSSNQQQQQEEEEECRDFAASFICENLLDGSKVNVDRKFQKYWVFKNEGDTQWNDSTRLQLQDEVCLPQTSNTESSKVGALQKSVAVPSVSKNGTGVVCVDHLAPSHPCNYQSSWRLTHSGNVFGPRVWCNVCVVDEFGSPVDSPPREEAERPHSSFEIVAVTTDQEESRQISLVPPNKCHVDRTSSNQPKLDENHQDDDSLLMTAFDMSNISDGARYIRRPSHETETFTAINKRTEKKDKKNVIDVFNRCKDEDEVKPKETDQVEEKPKSTEVINKEDELPVSQDPASENLNQEEKEDDAQVEPEKGEPSTGDVENFQEPPHLPTPENEDLSSSEEGGEESRESEEHAEEEQKDETSSCSDDLHSVDFNLDDNASMTSYDVSDFVVVPLPECFDVNQPLKAPENNTDEPAEVKEPVDVGEGSDQEEVSEDEEYEDSQPNSRIRMPEYKSEDSLLSKSLTPGNSIPNCPAVSLTPTKNKVPNLTSPLSPSDLEVVKSSASLSSAISQNLDAFKMNPSNPIPQPSTKPKVPMNQIKMSEPVPPPPLPFVSPKPVPQSVLDLDKPYPVGVGFQTTPYFVPFEQGWRRNPIPIPSSVGNDEPWMPAVPSCPLPQSEFTLNRNSSGIEFVKPSAVARTPDTSLGSRFETRVKEFADTDRPISPVLTNELPDDFYPAMEQAEDTFQTPPPSPSPRDEDISVPSIELSPLDRLYEMGFHDIELNREIYDSCNGDLNHAVQALVLRMEADKTLLG